jgi:D-alanyl-D-alanine carboxypeptidase
LSGATAVRIRSGRGRAVRALGFSLTLALVAGLGLTGTPPASAAVSSIVIDATTGQVLHEVDADRVTYPASLTKMMTLYLTFEALEQKRIALDKPLPVSAHAATQAPSKLGLNPGETITVEDAVLGVVTKSANDAAVVLAESLGGTEAAFARAMTEKARALGMTGTEFHNASGLPAKHQVTTARDMVVLARALVRDFPQYYHFFGTPEFTYDGQTFENHNRLLKTYPGADGIKTGYIHASGFNLVASAKRDGRRLIGVVLGGLSPRQRNVTMSSLLDAGFLRGTVREAALAPKPTVVADATAAPAAATESLAEGDTDEGDIPARARPAHRATSWGIQVGAFSRYAPAHLATSRATRAAPQLLAHTRRSIEALQSEDGKVYRARLMGLTEQQARKACEVLTARKIECVAVTADDDVTVATAGSSRSATAQ